jgi:hypothetical protein
MTIKIIMKVIFYVFILSSAYSIPKYYRSNPKVKTTIIYTIIWSLLAITLLCFQILNDFFE